MLLKMAAALAAFALSSQAQAGVVYDNGAPTRDSLRCADGSGRCGAAWVVYDNFDLSSSITISAVRWTAYLTGGLADFRGARAFIYGADPVYGDGKLLYTMTQPATASRNGLHANAYDMVIGGLDITLKPGSYWLGMAHQTSANFASVYCARNCLGGDSTQAGYHGMRVVYRNRSAHDYAFAFEGHVQVPGVQVAEPASLGLFGAGLLCMGWLQRASRRRTAGGAA